MYLFRAMMALCMGQGVSVLPRETARSSTEPCLLAGSEEQCQGPEMMMNLAFQKASAVTGNTTIQVLSKKKMDLLFPLKPVFLTVFPQISNLLSGL